MWLPGRAFILIFVVFAASTGANAADPFVVVHNLQWHNEHVDDYLTGLTRRKITVDPPFFDTSAAKNFANTEYPTLPNPPKGEFETSAEYKLRRDEINRKNSVAENARKRYVENRRAVFNLLNTKQFSAHQNAVAAEAKRLEIARSKDKQTYKRLLYYYPSEARRFDADAAAFPPFLQPSQELGEGNHGYADLKVYCSPDPFPCADLEVAKRIRAVSDAGQLVVIVGLTDATVTIDRTKKSIERGLLEQEGERLSKSAPEIGIRLLAEFFNPGSTRSVPMTQQKVAKTKEISGYEVKVTGKTYYSALFDLNESKVLLERKLENP